MMNSTTMQRQKRIITHITHYALLLLIILVFTNVNYTERQKENHSQTLVFWYIFTHFTTQFTVYFCSIEQPMCGIQNSLHVYGIWGKCVHVSMGGRLYFSMSMWRQEANFFCCLSLTFCLDWLASKALGCLSFHVPVLGECRILSPSYTQYAMPFLPSPQGHVLTPSTYLKPCTPLNTMSLPICPQC